MKNNHIVDNLPPMINRSKVFWATKRAFDIVASSIALVLLFPFMLLIALAIHIDDPIGGVFLYSEGEEKTIKNLIFINFEACTKMQKIGWKSY